MCEPVSITMAGAALATAAYSAYSSYQQGKAAEQLGEYNAKIAEMGAGDAIQRGAVEASKIRSDAYRMAVRQKVASMASGLSGEGLSDVIKGTIFQGGVDAETARNNGAREAWGYHNQATASRYEGATAKARAEGAMYGSILSGVGQAAAYGIKGAYSTKVPDSGALSTTTSAVSTTDFTLKPTPISIDYRRFGNG